MSPIDTDLEARLRRDLRARQDDAPPAPVDLADRVRRRHRRERRTQALTLVATAAVIAVVAGASNLLSAPPTPRTADTAETPGAAEPTILERPTRGSLAGDEAWLAVVRRLDWQVPAELAGEVPEPPSNERHVAFAGDVPGSRVALVVGQEDGRTGAVWFTGPTGAEAGDMVPVNLPEPAGSDERFALVQTEGPFARDGVLTVVTAPGESVDLTTPPEVAADGTETRPRIELPVVDGIVATRVEAAWTMGRELRTRGASSIPHRVSVTVMHPGQVLAVPPAPPPLDAVSDQALFDDLVAEVLADYDLTAEEARPTILARGDGYEGERVLLMGLTFPSGATGAWLLTGDQYSDGWSGGLARLPHAPAGTPLEERLIAVPVDGFQLALHGPERAVRAEVLTSDDRVLGRVDLDDGAFVGEVPGGSFFPSTDGAAGLRLFDASGDVVASGFIGRVVTE